MNDMTTAKITRSGQISLPAPVRRRWEAQRVLVRDEGDHVIVRPLPDDPIAAARGALADRPGPTTDELREEERRELER